MLTSISMEDVIDTETAVLHIPRMIRQDEYGYRTSVDAKDVAPLAVVPLNEPFRISKPGGAASTFILKRFVEGYYVCSCPAWKFSTERDKMRKTCSHLKDILGEQYETERISLAKEAKSTVWEQTKFRRTTSDGLHARHTQAKNVLDDHFRQLSQSQPETSTSNLKKPASTSKKPSRGHSTIDKIGTSSSTSALQAKPASRTGVQAESDTETEEEEFTVSQPGPSRRTPPEALVFGAAVTESPSVIRTRPAPQGSDDDSNGFDPDDVQLSPTKRARRGKKLTCDDEDDKASLLLAKPWLLDADPSKPRSRAMDPTGWWISEKLDGVRAFWDGQRLYSRQKIEWNAATWWKNRLPKDITLDGELWMSRGTFDQTSQVCRTTVRLGRLRTFSHFLERDSMERQWLREQVGGRIASQDRLRVERSVNTSTGSIGQVTDAAMHAAPASSAAMLSIWKSWKGSFSGFSKGKSRRKSRLKSPRIAFADSFLRALFGHAQINKDEPCPSDRQTSYMEALKRCPRCGKVVKRNKVKDASRFEAARSSDPAQERRVNSDRLFPDSALPSAPSTSVFDRTSNSVTTSTSTRRPHVYSILNSSRSGFTYRMVPSAYTHVCRRKSKGSNEWNKIKFMIFDAPSMGSKPVEERWAEIEKRFGSSDGIDIDSLQGPQIKLVKHIKCEGRDHLAELMKLVELKGGEGLMLRQPRSKYEGQRGNTLYKLKSWYDAEAEVIGYADGSGRHEGRTGSLVARMACGTVFRVGTGMSDAQREDPPPIGSIINYRFFELSEDGYPRFPAFRGLARDKSRPKDAVVRPRASALRAAEEA
ncbi:hypothetical protein NDA18_003270 [Ustilago nuda]|nr:hypothetical protein NDA18_003270 [Ustilago nuda]